MATYDCEPTLTDTQVLEFCREGFLLLEGVVSEETNRRTLEYLAEHGTGEDTSRPAEMLQEEWFSNDVIRNPAAAGAVRSLLGADFGLPIAVADHKPVCPLPAQEWHVDRKSMFGPAVDYLQVFYYPQDCPKEMGPTEVLPGSHHFYTLQNFMGHYGRLEGSRHVVAPSGSIFLTAYPIWHRRGESTGAGVRHNLKYNYWRTVAPKRDWVIEPDFDIARADYSQSLPIYSSGTPDDRVQWATAEMLCWLWGRSDDFKPIGGQGWPHGLSFSPDRPYGVPAELLGE